MSVLDQLTVPLVLAPLAGGASTPELAVAVSDAGGLGFLAAGYLSADELARRLRAVRAATGRPVAVNLFVPGPAAAPDAYAGFAARVAEYAAERGLPVGAARHTDDDWEAKLGLLLADPVPAVSFTFGLPGAAVADRLQAVGSEVWVTITSPEEAELAAQNGADGLVVQGSEAGGHRGSFADRPDLPAIGLLALLELVAARTSLPLIAAGGIATGAAVAAALAAGAGAAALGTAFMLCPEAGTSEAQRRALAAGGRDTALTRAFTGRLARGIRNEFIDAFTADAPIAYPELHYLTAPLRAAARTADDPEQINLWAGEAYTLARAEPAAEVMRRVWAETEQTVAALTTRATRRSPPPQ